MNASPGAAVGKAVFDSATAVEWAEQRRGRDPGPQGDQPRRPARHGRRPGASSPAAAARPRTRPSSRAAWAAPASAAPSRSTSTPRRGQFTVRGGKTVRRGRRRSRSTARPARSSTARCRSSTRWWCATSRATTTQVDDPLVAAVARLMEHADAARRLQVRANADTARRRRRARGGSAPRASGCAGPSTCSSATAASWSST